MTLRPRYDSGKTVPPFRNTTRFPTPFLKRMLSWACRQVELPRRKLHAAHFMNRRYAYSGRAYFGSGYGNRIVVNIGPDSCFPAKSRTHFDGFTVGDFSDAIEALVAVTVHEVAHIAAYRRKAKRTRCVGGNSERSTDWHEKQGLLAFRANREKLLAEWYGEEAPIPLVTLAEPEPEPEPMQVAAYVSPSSKAAVTRRTNAIKRAETDLSNAEAKIAEWKRKRALAETKLASWEAKRKNAAKRLASLNPEKVS